MDEFEIGVLPLLTLDIEGAEIKVLRSLLHDTAVRPSQVLVEFDELNRPSFRAAHNFQVTDRMLRRAGYQLAHWDPPADFLYTRV